MVNIKVINRHAFDSRGQSLQDGDGDIAQITKAHCTILRGGVSRLPIPVAAFVGNGFHWVTRAQRIERFSYCRLNLSILLLIRRTTNFGKTDLASRKNSAELLSKK